jgi:hypothetical protein
MALLRKRSAVDRYLTTALHRNASRCSVELQRLSASGERERSTASVTG